MYIRTKNNCIYKVVKENDDDFEVDTVNSYCDNLYDFYIDKKDVIKQGYTIEESCDFVFVQDYYHDYHLYDLRNKNTDKTYIKESWLDGWFIELYYCIKTDKGLIYVAKMNYKGDLELICD